MNRNHFWILSFFLVFAASAPAWAQSYAGESASIEPMMLIDKPTAGLLKRGAYTVTSNFYQNGGVLVGVAVGLFDPFTFGISYGGTGIIGHDKADMNPAPGVQVKFRILSETPAAPAVAIGFDSQGKEPYVNDRYTIKSPGFYAAASKNFSFLGNFSIHGGFNRSLEDKDGDKDLDFYWGAEKSIGNDISIMFEYDLGINDNTGNAVGKGNGYANIGVRWSLGKGLVAGFNLKDISKNQNEIHLGNRTLELDYIGIF